MNQQTYVNLSNNITAFMLDLKKLKPKTQFMMSGQSTSFANFKQEFLKTFNHTNAIINDSGEPVPTTMFAKLMIRYFQDIEQNIAEDKDLFGGQKYYLSNALESILKDNTITLSEDIKRAIVAVNLEALSSCKQKNLEVETYELTQQYFGAVTDLLIPNYEAKRRPHDRSGVENSVIIAKLNENPDLLEIVDGLNFESLFNPILNESTFPLRVSPTPELNKKIISKENIISTFGQHQYQREQTQFRHMGKKLAGEIEILNVDNLENRAFNKLTILSKLVFAKPSDVNNVVKDLQLIHQLSPATNVFTKLFEQCDKHGINYYPVFAVFRNCVTQGLFPANHDVDKKLIDLCSECDKTGLLMSKYAIASNNLDLIQNGKLSVKAITQKSITQATTEILKKCSDECIVANVKNILSDLSGSKESRDYKKVSSNDIFLTSEDLHFKLNESAGVSTSDFDMASRQLEYTLHCLKMVSEVIKTNNVKVTKEDADIIKQLNKESAKFIQNIESRLSSPEPHPNPMTRLSKEFENVSESVRKETVTALKRSEKEVEEYQV